jgi:hypothetical protein
MRELCGNSTRNRIGIPSWHQNATGSARVMRFCGRGRLSTQRLYQTRFRWPITYGVVRRRWQAASQFAAFAAGPDGSIVGLWLYAGPDSSRAPVVHLGSEGQHNFVLASDIREFLELLGIGYGELGFDDLSLEPTEAETADALRAWLLQEFGIRPPRIARPLVQAAQSRHPSLENWIREWQKQRYGD